MFSQLIPLPSNFVCECLCLATACEAIRKSIELQTTTFARQNQPFKMGIITYDSEIHFYNLSPGLGNHIINLILRSSYKDSIFSLHIVMMKNMTVG